MNEFDLAIGHWMAQEREARGISQEALALQLGRDQPSLSKMERGIRKVSVADLLKWAEKLSVPDKDLLQAIVRLRGRFFPPQFIQMDRDD